MSLFTAALIEPFRSNPQIRQALNGNHLLHFEEFKDWYLPQPSPLQEAQVIGDLATIACEGNIGPVYIQRLVQSLSDGRADFDILIVVDSRYEESREGIPVTDKLKHVIGFVIAELGECKDKPNVYSINLICTRTVGNASIKSLVLLGAFEFCIKNSISGNVNTDEGILELADGYINMPGFISYTKMGFKKTEELSGATCFTDYNNLPMRVDLTRLTNDEIIARAAGWRPTITPEEDDSGLFNARVSPDDQRTAIRLNNIVYKLTIDPTIIQNPEKLLPNEAASFRAYLKRFYKTNRRDVDPLYARSEILKELKRRIQGTLTAPEPEASRKRSGTTEIAPMKRHAVEQATGSEMGSSTLSGAGGLKRKRRTKRSTLKARMCGKKQSKKKQ